MRHIVLKECMQLPRPAHTRHEGQAADKAQPKHLPRPYSWRVLPPSLPPSPALI